MARTQNPNLEILELAVDQLGELADEMVFVGGCATGLLITDQAAPPIRVTKDVDAIVQVVTHSDYYALSEKLRERGFREDVSEGAPICRWATEEVTLDVMPTDARILGFGNKWYHPAMQNAEVVELPSGKQIRMVSAPFFLITKLEAFEGRGGGDYQLSHDVEDIISVIDGRPELLDEIKRSEQDLSNELASRIKILLGESRFIDAIPGHMPPDETSQARVAIVVKILGEIAEIE
jgi:predicted nucleotidyltransferase